MENTQDAQLTALQNIYEAYGFMQPQTPTQSPNNLDFLSAIPSFDHPEENLALLNMDWPDMTMSPSIESMDLQNDWFNNSPIFNPNPFHYPTPTLPSQEIRRRSQSMHNSTNPVKQRERSFSFTNNQQPFLVKTSRERSYSVFSNSSTNFDVPLPCLFPGCEKIFYNKVCLFNIALFKITHEDP